MENSKLQQVLDILKAQGYSEEQLAKFLEELTKNNFARMYTEAMTSLTEEDLAKIDLAATDEEGNKLIADLYQQRTGKNPQEESNRFIDTFCEGFLREHQKG